MPRICACLFVRVFVGVFVWVGFCITGFNLRRIAQHWIDLLNLIKHWSASRAYYKEHTSQTCICARMSDGWCEVLVWWMWCVVYGVIGENTGRRNRKRKQPNSNRQPTRSYPTPHLDQHKGSTSHITHVAGEGGRTCWANAGTAIRRCTR